MSVSDMALFNLASLCSNATAAPKPVCSRRGPWLQLGAVQGFEWNHLEVPIVNLPPAMQGLRIVHLTDTHVRRRWSAAYDELIGRLRRNRPDLILFTGDFVDDKSDHRPALSVLRRLITQLSSRLGLYAIAGNHDGELLAPRIKKWGIRVIDHRYVLLGYEDASIELIGLPGVKRRHFNPAFVKNIVPRKNGVPRIILGHYPDQVSAVDCLQADLMLVGHTHGGQICLPNGWPLLTHDTLPRHMARGAHRVGQTLLVVNRGFGFSRWPIRLFCPAEVIEIRLCAAN